ncbi:hypothetical protein LEMLEM_LOCUS10072, partial [Lemmus lemmus]
MRQLGERQTLEQAVLHLERVPQRTVSKPGYGLPWFRLAVITEGTHGTWVLVFVLFCFSQGWG